jgi:omega-amidase
MKIKIAQLIVQRDIESNKEKILKEIAKVEKDEWIVFPEAILSGYYPVEKIYTRGLNWKLIQNYLNEIEHFVKEKKCHCLLGSATLINDVWRNSVFTFSYLNNSVRHDKIQLSKLDKKHFVAGENLMSHNLNGINYGMLACRELIFPNQWLALKMAGSQIIFHLNNAIQPQDVLWKDMLITRAIENSVFVVSVNNADSPQQLASYVISPRGEILAETVKQKEQSLKVEIDLNQVIENLERREDY